MVNLDVDELVVTDDGISLFEHLARSAEGALSTPGDGFAMFAISIPGRPTPLFPLLLHRDQPYLTKWTVVPSRLKETAEVGVHTIFHGMTPYADPAITFRHFPPSQPVGNIRGTTGNAIAVHATRWTKLWSARCGLSAGLGDRRTGSLRST